MEPPVPLRPGLLPVVVLAAVAFVAGLWPCHDPDVFFHIAMGREILDTGSVPSFESRCLVSEGQPFQNHEWLFDAGVAAVDRVGGLAAVAVLKALLASLLFVLSALVGIRLGGRPWTVVLVLLAFLPLFRGTLDARPQVVGYALAAGMELALLAIGKGRRLPWVLAILTGVIWTNLHGSFPLMFVLWGVEVLRRLVRSGKDRSGTWVLLAAGPALGLATVATPWGWGLWAVVWHHLDPLYREIVPEFRPRPFGEEPLGDALFLSLAIAGTLSFLSRENRKRIADMVLFLAFLLPAVAASRFLLGLAVGGATVLAANLARTGFLREGLRRFGGVTAFVVFVAATPWMPPHAFPGLVPDLVDFPQAALEGTAGDGGSGRLFTSFAHGGFCEFTLPESRPFIDGRAYVHGLDGVRTYLGALSDYREFRRLDSAHRFDAVVADLQDPAFPRLMAGLRSATDFAMVWLDDQFAVYRRTPTKLSRFSLLRPGLDPRYLLELPEDRIGQASIEVDRVLGSPSGQTLGRLLRGTLALRLAGLREPPTDSLPRPANPSACTAAETDFAFLVDSRPDVGMFRYFLAVAQACQGDCESAVTGLVEAAEFPDARRLYRTLRAGPCPR